MGKLETLGVIDSPAQETPMAKHDATKVVMILATLVLLTVALGTFAAQTPQPKPAFPGQTKAPAPPVSAPFQTQIITERLSSPWSLAFLPDGTFLVTENGGTIRV